jgi:hypothetical protein
MRRASSGWNDVDDDDDDDDDRAAGFMYRRQLNARADLPQTYAFTTTINIRGVNSMIAAAAVYVKYTSETAVLILKLKKHLAYANTVSNCCSTICLSNSIVCKVKSNFCKLKYFFFNLAVLKVLAF